MPFPYEIEVVNPELEIYNVRNTKNHNSYQLIKKSDGGFSHQPECKARLVYGNGFLCRHVKMVLGKFYAHEEYRYLFNISPVRKKKL
jgi:hypothetical protein